MLARVSLVLQGSPTKFLSGRALLLKIFLPSPYCQGFYRRQELWKHTAVCYLKPDGDQLETQKKVQVNSKLMLLGALTKSSNSMLDNVLATMRKNDTTLTAKNDELILGAGKLLVEKHGISKAQDTSQTMRE
jgi:hypothetical protein